MYRITERESLLPHNTFGMDVRAAHFLEYDTVEDLRQVLPVFRTSEWWHIGRGSNLLFTGDYAGWILHSSIRGSEVMKDDGTDVLLRVGAGEVWDDVVAWAVAHGLYGAENLSLIPGETGAAAVQNIGAYGAEAADIISGVVCFDLQERRKVKFSAAECRYGYRDSLFKQAESKGRYVVTSVLFRLSRKPRPRLDYKGMREALDGLEPATPQEVREAVIRIRRQKLPDPEELGSAGSFFKNPVVSREDFARISPDGSAPHYELPDGTVKIPAAWLIERCGFKGASEGGAAVYEKQPLVLVNASGTASPQEVLALESRIISGVQERFGVTLAPEVEHI